MNTNSTSKVPQTDSKGNRLCFYLGVYVSRDGKEIYKLENGQEIHITIHPAQGKWHSSYVEIDGVKKPLDFLVAACYKPAPKDGNQYEIVHIDGNPNNCDVNNLQWKIRTVTATTTQPLTNSVQHSNTSSIPSPQLSPFQAQQKKPYYLNTYPECKFGSITVKKDGTVLENGKPVVTSDCTFDGDVDLCVCISPYFVSQKRNRVFIDELVVKARYVQGSPDGMIKPVVLHKDHNFNNFASDNLEWVEEDSPEYRAYRKDEVEYRRKRNIELNPRVDFPEFMQPKY